MLHVQATAADDENDDTAEAIAQRALLPADLALEFVDRSINSEQVRVCLRGFCSV
jgi:hypothetical protein